MEEIAFIVLSSEQDISGNFEKNYYSRYQIGMVKFDIGAQGMLGGQYWSLVYTKDCSLYGEFEKYSYIEDDGNDIIRSEKLNGNWWFCWIDYDGY